jgi:hypothetical protein
LDEEEQEQQEQQEQEEGGSMDFNENCSNCWQLAASNGQRDPHYQGKK